MTTYTHFVKVRKQGEKLWSFLGSTGSVTRLRIYAAQYAESDAQTQADSIPKLNPGYEAKIVPIDK